MNSLVRSKLREEEKAEFDILEKFNREGQFNSSVEPAEVLLQLDRLEVLKNLKMIELNESDIDPELVRFEKLKARVLLEEPGAAEEYTNYVNNRAFHKKFEGWATGEETVKQQVVG